MARGSCCWRPISPGRAPGLTAWKTCRRLTTEASDVGQEDGPGPAARAGPPPSPSSPSPLSTHPSFHQTPPPLPAQPVVGPAPPASRLQRRALVRGRGAGEPVTAPRHLPPSPHQRNSSAHKWAKMAKFATAHVDVDRHARRHQQLTHLETIAPRGVSQSVRTAKPPHARRRPAWRLASRRPHPTRRPSAVTSPPSPSVPFFYLLAGRRPPAPSPSLRGYGVRTWLATCLLDWKGQ